MNDVNREHLGQKSATLTAVLVVGFLCGWSATGLIGGILLALALGAGVAVPIFGSASATSPFCNGRSH